MSDPKVLRKFFNEIFSQNITNIKQAYKLLNVKNKDDAYALLEKEYSKYNTLMRNEEKKNIIQRSKDKVKTYVEKVLQTVKTKKPKKSNKPTKPKKTKNISVGISLYLPTDDKKEATLSYANTLWTQRSRSNGNGASFYLEFTTDKYTMYFRELTKMRYTLWNTPQQYKYNKLTMKYTVWNNTQYNKLITLIEPFQGSSELMTNLYQLQQSQDNILIRIQELGYDKAMNAPINYVDASAFDDDTAKYLSNKYISMGDELYKTEYVKDNYLKRSCWLNLIVDTFKTTIEKYYKNIKVDYQFVHNILRPDTQLLGHTNGYSFNEVINFFKKFKVALYMFDINDNVVAYYEPEKRNRNINPEIVYVLFHNKHVFKFNENLKSLEQKIEHRLNKLNEVCPKPSAKYYLKEGDEEQQTLMINDYDELTELIKTHETEDSDIRILYNKASCFDLWLELYNNGFEPSVLMTNGEVCFKFLRLLNVTFGNRQKKNILLYTLEEDGVYNHKQFDTEDVFNNYMNKTTYASNYLLTTNYVSSYADNVNAMLHKYMKAPLIGKFKTIAPVNDKCIHIDYNKFYTSILNEIKEFPVVNSFDDFTDFKGQDIKDYNLYFVEKLRNDECYPFHKFSLCYGMNIKDVNGIKILKVLNVSKTKKNNANEVINKLYTDNKLTAKMRKDIINHIVGKYNKKTNKKYYSSVSTDKEEAIGIKNNYGGALYKQTIKQYNDSDEELDDDFDEMEYINQKQQEDITYDYEEDPFLINRKKTDNGLTLYINHIENETKLNEGFRLLSLMIYDIAHKKLLDLKQTIEQNYGLNVYGCNTDCLYLENDVTKFKAFQTEHTELFNFVHKDDYEAIGKIKVEMNKVFGMGNEIKHLYNENICDTLDFTKHTSNILQVNNEFDKNEIADIINTNTNVVVTAEVAGAGKTTNFINFAVTHQKKTLIIAPYNTLCLDLNQKTKDYDGLVESITIHKLLGLVFDGKTTTTQCAGFNLDGVKCIVFDEIYLLNTSELMRVKEFMRRHTEIEFYATGDEYQNAPIDNNLYMDKDEVKPYYNSIVTQLFPNKIVLKENKRCTTDADRQIIKDLSNDIRSLENKQDIWKVFKKYNIKTTDKIRTRRNVCALNQTCDWVNEQLSNVLNKENKYQVGQQLICRKTFKQGKLRTYINFTYTITEVTENGFILDDGLETIIELKAEQVKNGFRFPYARTCHSYQGLTEDQPITIFDINHFMVDKYWIYTAITRTTSIENINIFKNESVSNKNQDDERLKRLINRYYYNDVDYYKHSSMDDYITVDWVKEQFQTIIFCKYCDEQIECNDCNGFSIRKIDGSLPHVKMNCEVICSMCHHSMK